MLNNVIILKNVTHDDASDINKDNVTCVAYTELELGEKKAVLHVCDRQLAREKNRIW